MRKFLRRAVFLPWMMMALGCSTNPEKVETEFFVAPWAEGTWQYVDSKGETVTVTLYNDGSALSSDESIGSWFFIDKSVYITWMSGWMDMIKSENGHYEKFGFAPGVSTDSPPTNKSMAIKIKNN